MGSYQPTSLVMQIGDESTSNLAQNRKTKRKKKDMVRVAWAKYLTWFFGMLLSFIPVLLFPFYLCAIGQVTTFPIFVAKVLYQSDIVYMVISLSVAALNDADDCLSDFLRKVWQCATWLLIILSAVIFGALKIAENTSANYTGTFASKFNGHLLLFCLIVGSVPYITSLITAYKLRKEGA